MVVFTGSRSGATDRHCGSSYMQRQEYMSRAPSLVAIRQQLASSTGTGLRSIGGMKIVASRRPSAKGQFELSSPEPLAESAYPLHTGPACRSSADLLLCAKSGPEQPQQGLSTKLLTRSAHGRGRAASVARRDRAPWQFSG